MRFVAVGAFSAALNLALLGLLVDGLHVPYLRACTISFFVLNFIGYRLNKAVTFQLGRRILWPELVRYFVIMALSLAVNLGLMALLVGVLGIGWLPAAIIVTVLLAAANFLAHRHVTFAPRAIGEAATPRILQVSAFFPAHGGGIEVVAGQLARRLAQAGCHVEWMAGGSPDERPADTAPDTTGTLLIDQARSFDVLERRIGLPAPVWNFASLGRLWRRTGDCDVVHVHDYLYLSSLLAILFARLRGRPVVLTQHIGDIPFESRAPRLVLRVLNRTLGRWTLGSVDQVAFVGQPVRAHFEPFVRFRRPPLLVSNGVDHALYRPLHAAPAPSADGPLRALFVGRFVEKKGLELLRRCIAIPGIDWTFVGRGPLSPLDWQPAPANVTLRGILPPPAVADEMRAADVLVLASKGEGFPLVVQEALACGTPVLVSRDVADAFPQTDARCVWSVDVAAASAQDTDAPVARLRAELERLRDARADVRAARAPAAALAAQWSWDRCVQAYLAAYRAVLAPANPPRTPP